MSVPNLDVDLVLHAHPRHGEGPTWDDRDGCLIWLDLLGGDVHRYRPSDGEADRIHVGDVVGAAVPTRSGDLLLAADRGFVLLEAATLTPLVQVLEDPNVRFNEGKCDPAGRLWAGTMAYDASPGQGALFRLDADLSVHRVVEGLSVSNGMAWSDDAKTMYFIDSASAGIDAFSFDLETGEIGRRRRIIEIDPADGIPDGLAIDSEGGLWVALFGGSAVHRYRPSGVLDRSVRLPVSNVTSCTFGGPGLTDLYITTSPVGLSASQLAEQPLAGAVFACAPGTSGAATDRFDG